MEREELSRLQGRRVIAGHTVRATQARLLEKSAAEHQAALQKIRQGGVATRVRILVNHDCCPACRAIEGAYDFDNAPALPIEECSHPMGCRCHYAPVLDRFGP
ncbi:MAG: hypothetical protein AB1791_00415 [Chloroflexota bacterium]